MLSVVVPTTKAWPELEPCLEALRPQVQALRAEVLVGDGEGGGLPDDAASRYPWVVRDPVPGASVFDLRARAIATARGRLVAFTEDHCVPAADWCERIVAVHDLYPDAIAVAGAVRNGSCRYVSDWANFLFTFAHVAPPLGRPEPHRIATVSNFSFKRNAIPPGPFDPGWFEQRLAVALAREDKLAYDGTIVVDHVQSYGFIGTFRAHYHNGRSTGGLTALRQPWRQRRRQLLQQIVRPVRLFAETLRPLRRKPELRHEIAISLPWLFAISCTHALGETVGFLLGPGESPRRLV